MGYTVLSRCALGYSPVVIHVLVMNPEVPGIADS